MFLLFQSRSEQLLRVLRIKEEFERRAAENRTVAVKSVLTPDEEKIKEEKSYSRYAEMKINDEIKTEDEMYNSLICNMEDFDKYSFTTYNEYMTLYYKILDKAKIQTSPNDVYVMPYRKKRL